VASLAKAYCSEAYVHCATEKFISTECIGLHVEHPANLYYKRAKFLRVVLFGWSHLPSRAAGPAASKSDA